MQHALQSGKRVFAAVVAAATIAMSAGFAAFVPATASAASAGDLIKGSLSTVYFHGYDGARYTFPNYKTYDTWFDGFSDVTTISDAALAAIDLGGNVVYRPGSLWIKIESDPKVYAVSTDGMIHWIESEEVAMDFAGSDWASHIEDVPDAFFVDYTVGASLMSAEAYDGMLWVDGGTYYTEMDGAMHSLSSAARSANDLESRFFLDGSDIDTSGLTSGAAITGSNASLMDASQTYTGSVVTEGDLEISLSSSTANGVSLPGGANAVEVLSFDVEAGSEDGMLNGITFSMEGVGGVSNISNVYLYEGVERLTEARSVNAATRQVTFGSLRLAVEAGETRTFTVRVETSSSQTAADTFFFTIDSADDVDATGDVGGRFPVEGETFTFTSADVGEVDITRSGTIDNATVGEQDAVIGEFRIASTTEDAEVRAISLTVEDAADHDDYKLWDGEEMLAAGEWVSGDLISFDLSDAPFDIEEGSSNVFSVSADIGGETGDAIKVYLDNAVDLEVVGGDYGFGLAVDSNDSNGYDGEDEADGDALACSSASDSCSYSTIEGGDITIVGNGPTARDVQTDSQDVELLNFSITTAEEVTVKDLDIIVYGDDNDNNPFETTDDGTDSDTDGLVTGTEASLKDIKIVNADTGVVVMGPLELDNLTDDASQIIDFSDDFVIDSGDTMNLKVTADIDNNVGADTEFGATFDMSGLVLEDANGDTITTGIVPSGDIQGYTQTAKSASLTVALASTPGDVVTVDGSDDVLVNAFTFTAGTAGDIDVNSVKISVYADEDNSGTFTAGDVTGNLDVNDFVESCYLTNAAGTMLGSAKSPNSSGTNFTVTSMNWTVEAGDTETLKVYCNFANPSDGTDDNAFAFDIADLSEDVVSQDEEGNDVDATTDAPNGGTTPTNSVYVHDAGTLAVTASANMPTADFILTSSSDVHVASYTFTATREDFEVQTLSFSEEEATDDRQAASAYANNISLLTVSYENAEGEVVEKSAAMSGNEVKFTLSADEYLYVPVGEPQEVDVYVNVPLTDRDAGGSATSNEEVRIAWFVDASGNDNFKAVGTGSGVLYTDTDSDGAGTNYSSIGDDSYSTDGVATFVVRETKPTFSVSSSSSSSSDATPGIVEALRFNVAASSNENVVLERITFKLTASDNQNSDWDACKTDGLDATYLDDSDFALYEVTGSTMTQLDTADTDWTLWKATGAACDTTAADVGFVTINLPTAELVSKSGTATYALKIDASQASSSANDTLRADIVTDLTANFLATSTANDLANEDGGVITADETVITVASGSDFMVGDVICIDGGSEDTCASSEERMLVVGKSTNDLTVVRGYMNSPVIAIDTTVTGFEVMRAVGSLLWQDDGSISEAESNESHYGAYMVDYLDLNGGTLVF